MAEFSYDQLQQQQSMKKENKDYAKVGYFNSLKNDKDEAIVRFVYSSTSEFNMAWVHSVQVNGNYRYISCLRSGLDPVEKCPLCAKEDANTKLKARFFIKLIEYVKDDKGNNVPVAKIWDRPAKKGSENSYELNTLASLVQEFGDLRNMVFKIKRHGLKGSLQTSYEIVAVNQAIYPESAYPKDFSAFDNFDLGRHSYYALNFDEVNYFVNTGEIPPREIENKSTEGTSQQTQNTNNVNQSVGGQPGAQAYAQQNYNNNSGVAQSQQQMQYAEQNPFEQQPQSGVTGNVAQGVNPPYQPPVNNQQNQVNQAANVNAATANVDPTTGRRIYKY